MLPFSVIPNIRDQKIALKNHLHGTAELPNPEDIAKEKWSSSN
jgi:hypothetical protein